MVTTSAPDESEQEVKRRNPSEALKHLRKNGVKIKIDVSSNAKIDEKPEWLDEIRFSKAHTAINKFQMGVDFSSFTGLLLILQLPDGLEPLLSTGKSKDVASLFDRYLSTVLHVRSWYTDDIFDSTTKGYKSIRQVRAMHRNVQRIMNDKFQVNDVHGNSRLWVNQYDVAITQFSFIGLAMIFPEKSGLIGASKEELELINYYWRVLGYMMGLEDEFNACQFDKYSDIREFFGLIFEQEFKQSFERHPCQMGLAMTQAVCLSLQDFLPLITFNSLAHWWSDTFSFNGYQLQPLTPKERVLLKINRVSFETLFKFESLVKLTTKLHTIRFNRLAKKRNKIQNKLAKYYANQENLTFYSQRCDYFDNKLAKDATQLVMTCPFRSTDRQNAA